MKKLFYSIVPRNKKFWTRPRVLSLVKSLGLLLLALAIQKLADVYVGDVKGVVVPDLLLDHLPTVDIAFLIVQGALILTAVIAWLLLAKPRYVIFTLTALSIFIIIRSFFVSLTHLGVSPRELPLDTDSLGFGLYNSLYNSKGDFFFSGHTGAPFLMALIFWQEKFWRWFFLATAFVFAAAVLLAHVHYSIDVFAAPFITYSIFTIAKIFFPEDFALTKETA